MLLILYFLYLSIAFSPFATARPYQHAEFHKLNHLLQHHHERHSSYTPIPDNPTQQPLGNIDSTPESANPPNKLNISAVHVSVSFHSIPQWPRSGEETDLVIVPLGKWITPGL